MEIAAAQSSQVQDAPLVCNPLQIEEKIAAVKLFRREDAEVLDAFGQRVLVLLPATATAGEVSFLEVDVPAGDSPPYHVHRREDETFFIRKGRFEFILNGERHEVGPGDVIYGPRNVPHTFRNISDTNSVLQVLAVSAGFENFFRSCSHAFAQNSGMETILQIAADHGLEFLPPDSAPVSIEGNAPRITRTDEAEAVAHPDSELNVLVSNETTNGLFSVIEGTVSPGAGPAPHSHSREDEIFILRDGELTLGEGSDAFIAQSGDIVWAPRSTRHAFTCTGSTHARTMIAILPGEFENYFRDTSRLLMRGEISRQDIEQLSAKYGMKSLA